MNSVQDGPSRSAVDSSGTSWSGERERMSQRDRQPEQHARGAASAAIRRAIGPSVDQLDRSAAPREGIDRSDRRRHSEAGRQYGVKSTTAGGAVPANSTFAYRSPCTIWLGTPTGRRPAARSANSRAPWPDPMRPSGPRSRPRPAGRPSCTRSSRSRRNRGSGTSRECLVQAQRRPQRSRRSARRAGRRRTGARSSRTPPSGRRTSAPAAAIAPREPGSTRTCWPARTTRRCRATGLSTISPQRQARPASPASSSGAAPLTPKAARTCSGGGSAVRRRHRPTVSRAPRPASVQRETHVEVSTPAGSGRPA